MPKPTLIDLKTGKTVEVVSVAGTELIFRGSHAVPQILHVKPLEKDSLFRRDVFEPCEVKDLRSLWKRALNRGAAEYACRPVDRGVGLKFSADERAPSQARVETFEAIFREGAETFVARIRVEHDPAKQSRGESSKGACGAARVTYN